MSVPVLSINKLTKKYGNITALDEVSFDVPSGSVFGLLGPNGSGKTTTLGIVMDILKQTSGSFQFSGKMPTADTRKNIGTLLETPNFYHYLSAQKNLEIAAAIKVYTPGIAVPHPINIAPSTTDQAASSYGKPMVFSFHIKLIRRSR